MPALAELPDGEVALLAGNCRPKLRTAKKSVVSRPIHSAFAELLLPAYPCGRPVFKYAQQALGMHLQELPLAHPVKIHQ